MAKLMPQGSVVARCPGCGGATSTFEWASMTPNIRSRRSAWTSANSQRGRLSVAQGGYIKRRAYLSLAFGSVSTTHEQAVEVAQGIAC
jgi:pyruvate/2-oxoacid:ferredoxin oxidoreductase beta subunit